MGRPPAGPFLVPIFAYLLAAGIENLNGFGRGAMLAL
jgi:hypothetical protein